MNIKFYILVLSGYFFCYNVFAQPCTTTGTFSVGPTGNYSSLTAAATALRADGPAGPVILELQPAYNSSVETFPVSFAGISCMDITKTITIRPQAAATGLIISTSGKYTLDLNQTRHLIIDGRPGGTGTLVELSIINTHDTGSAVRFVNGASQNTLKYLNLRGSASLGVIGSVTTFDTTAVVKFEASAISNGCDSNTISNCNIYEAGTVTPGTLIYAAGASGKSNDFNSVVNCHLYNYYQQDRNSYGIYVTQYNSRWMISDNSFYQTGPRTYLLSTFTPDVYGIKISTSLYAGFVINGNYVGGTQPSAGGTAMNLAGNFVYTAIAVAAVYLPAYPSYVNQNTVANFSLSPNNNIAMHSGIQLGVSPVNFYGECYGNLIGSTTTNGNIFFNPTGNSSTFIGIGAPIGSTIDPTYVKGNRISGVTLSGNSPSFWGINAGGLSNQVIDSNSIGVPALTNSILNNSGGENFGVRIANYSSSSKIVVSRNTITNITVNSFGSISGIYTEGSASGRYLIEKNVISYLSSASSNSSSTASAVNGISLNIDGIPALNVSRNIIENLKTTSSSGANYINGIYYEGPAAGADSIFANVITSFTSSSTGNVSFRGIHLQSGNSLIYNNVIRLGVDADGNDVTRNYNISGISEAAGLNKVLHNSVYIGGNNVTAPTANTYGFTSAVTTGTRVIANNIFYNARSTTSGAGKNYCISIPGTAPDPPGLYLDYNLYFTDGTNGFVGKYNGTDYNTINAWASAIQRDNNTQFINPNFQNITGPVSSMDYHLALINTAEGKGTNTNTVLKDIDDETRTGLTPVDIGADAGLYTYSVFDNLAPVISFTALPNAVNINNITLAANISDAGAGVDTTGNSDPRIWFRRKSPNQSAWVSNPGVLISGTINSGTFNFIIDYSLISGTTHFEDTIEYYVVAQDKAIPFNTGSFQLAQHTSVNTQVSAPVNPNSYIIVPQLIGDIFVGQGQLYTSLSNNGGLFKAINTWGISGDITVRITSDLIETGVNYLKNAGLHGHAVRIVPATTGVKTITNHVATQNGLISFNQTTAPIEIDGNFNGSGRYLNFAYASDLTTSSSVQSALYLGPGTRNFTVKNCILESDCAYGMSGTLHLEGGGSGNIHIENNIIKDLQTHPFTTGRPSIGIYVNSNSNLHIKDNQVFNAYNTLLKIDYGADSCFITGNHFYNTVPFEGTRLLKIYGGKEYHVKDNFFGGTAPGCAGSPLLAQRVFAAMDIMHNPTPGIDMNMSIQNNVIKNIKVPFLTSGNTESSFYGIKFKNVPVINIGNETKNIIGDINDPAGIDIDVQCGTLNVGGIWYTGSEQVNISNNEIGGIKLRASTTYSSTIGGIVSPAEPTVVSPDLSNVVIADNIIKNISIDVQNINGASYDRLYGIVCGNTDAYGNVLIKSNTISGLTAKFINPNSLVAGIGAIQKGQYSVTTIEKNRISDMRHQTVGGRLAGIRISNESFDVRLYNNQISVTNGNLTNPVKAYGIWSDADQLGTTIAYHSYMYNSIYVGGQSSVPDTSVAFMHANNSPRTAKIINFRNNILYNGRTSPSGMHSSLWVNTTANLTDAWTAATSDHNLMIVEDTLKAVYWQGNGALRISQFKQLSGGDQNSYISLPSIVPAGTFFKNTDTANLDINNMSDLCWYVNGKGTPIDSIGTDYDNDNRSVTINGGATDIGSDEFNTVTLPPVLQVFGRHMPGGADTLVWGGRQVAIINWHNSGMLPTFGQMRWYTGVWPNDTTNNGTIHNARFMNSYLQIPANGGSNYRYDLSMNYSPALLGTITDPAIMILNKREINTNGSWKKIIPSISDIQNKSLKVIGQTSFSEFTGTDSNAALSLDDVQVITGDSDVVNISENPVKDNLTVSINLSSAKNIDLSIFDATGKLLKNYSTVASGVFSYNFNLQQYSNGIYFLKATVAHKKTTVRFLKVK